jgi:hypothetical protein
MAASLLYIDRKMSARTAASASIGIPTMSAEIETYPQYEIAALNQPQVLVGRRMEQVHDLGEFDIRGVNGDAMDRTIRRPQNRLELWALPLLFDATPPGPWRIRAAAAGTQRIKP